MNQIHTKKNFFYHIIEVLEKLIAALEAADLPQPAAHLSEAIDALEVETERASSTQILKLNIAYHGKKVWIWMLHALR